MKALVKVRRGPGNVMLMEMPEPKPGPGEVLIEVSACGICGTDMHIYHDTIDSDPPVIMGHELSGTVVQLGEDVKGVALGDRVTSETHAHLCGRCQYCLSGLFRYCVERTMVGRNGNGGFAKYYVTKQDRLTKLPATVSFAAGAVTEPLFTVTCAVAERAAVQAGDTVVIIGPGPMGLLAVQVAKALGAKVVVCGISVDRERLVLAEKFGADLVINLQENSPEKLIKDMTGIGADVVVVCAGSGSAIGLGFKLLRKRGKFVQIGLAGKPVEIDLDVAVFGGFDIIGTVGTTYTAKKRALSMLEAGLVNPEPIISDILPLTDWELGFNKMEKKDCMKILLRP